MKISHRESAPTRGTSAHRAGGIGFIALLQGTTDAVDNYDLSISLTSEDFFTPRHHHNFDQVRYILSGEFSFDRGRVQKAGQLSYFCEGTYYEQKGIGKTETLILQLAGASGSGYMSFDQLYATASALTKRGTFTDGVFTWHDNAGVKHNVDGYQAVWEEVNGRKISYPKPRYDGPVILNPENFGWVPLADVTGVEARELGRFNERGLTVAQLRLAAGARLPVYARPAETLLFVEQGAGTAGGEPLRKHSAVSVARDETLQIEATTPMILMRLRLPCFDKALAA
jgi:quercetin dioxygenase-like cupin family protein